MLALRWFIEPLQISVLAQIFDFTFPFMKLLRLASSKEECKAFDFREELCESEPVAREASSRVTP